MGQKQVPNYLDVGPDENGRHVIIYFPALQLIEETDPLPPGILPPSDKGDEDEPEQLPPKDAVRLTFVGNGNEKILRGAQAKKFLEILGLREPETNRIIVPDVARGSILN